MSPSLMQILIVVVLVLIFFGRGRISNFMGDLASGIKSFRKGLEDETNDNEIENNDHDSNRELLIVAVVLLIVVGPRELPGLLRIIFDFISKIRVYASELRTGVQSIANDLEIEKISKNTNKSIKKTNNKKNND